MIRTNFHVRDHCVLLALRQFVLVQNYFFLCLFLSFCLFCRYRGMGPDKNVRGHVQIVHGDDYFNVTLDDPTSYVDCPNLEGPGAIDWIALLWVVRVVEDVAMTTTVVAATTEDRRGDSIITTQQQPTVIVEGFLLLANPSLLARLDLILFLEADETSCLQQQFVNAKHY